jgi:hypothetical protein
LLAAGSLALALEETAAPFAWKATYRDALAAALRRRTLFVLYFPPVDAANEPPVVRIAARALGIPPVVEGARVGADEILDLKERFHVKDLPAVVLLDRRENALQRWEGRLPNNLWALVEALARRFEKRDAEDRKAVAEGIALAVGGDLAGAYRKVMGLLASERTPPEILEEARDVEARVIASGRKRLLAALAVEGVAPDATLRADLAALREREVHPGVRAEIGREIERLEGRTLGARR